MKIMNEPASRQTGPALQLGTGRRRLVAGTRRMARRAVLLCWGVAVPALAESPCPGIHVTILNIRNSTGTVACALFESAEGFPNEYLRSATNVMVIKIRKAQARCDFEDIPPGTYAMGVVHDENMNGKLDANWLGIPTEGYGFSNDAKGVLGPPPFSAASFSYDGRSVELTMRLQYGGSPPARAHNDQSLREKP